ncbi:MAG: hypothetical protein WAM79_18665 [Candidatus Sulfotelmatobacter sp.]
MNHSLPLQDALEIEAAVDGRSSSISESDVEQTHFDDAATPPELRFAFSQLRELTSDFELCP